MKVSELIEELSGFHKEKEVIISVEEFSGIYGEYSCMKKAMLESTYTEGKDTVILYGTIV